MCSDLRVHVRGERGADRVPSKVGKAIFFLRPAVQGDSRGCVQVRGKRVLIMDEVDDTRTTLKYCVEEVRTCMTTLRYRYVCALRRSDTVSTRYMLACMHACMDTCKAYIHTYVRTYVRTYIHTYNHTYMHAYMRKYIHAYIHTCMHTYINTYMHTYMHKYKVRRTNAPSHIAVGEFSASPLECMP